VLVLETLEHATARLAPILAEVQAFASSSDAAHVSAPPADGSGAALAMARALRAAGVEPAEVAHVNAHATSTPLGDAAELAALRTVRNGPGWARLLHRGAPTTMCRCAAMVRCEEVYLG
jgi:3-oxoacyl-[acyl-carrier-protein] synthase II